MSSGSFGYIFNESELMSSNILIQIRCYPMTEDKFNKLINNSSKLGAYSKDVLFIGIGIAIKVISVWAIVIYKSHHDSNNIREIISKIDTWEYLAIIICLFLSLILKLLSKCIVTDRDNLIKSIRRFYNEGSNG